MVKNPSTKAKTESVDEVILRLLGLKPGVEIDYQTYHDIIKKKLAIGRLSGKELPIEEDELLREEFKRVRSLKDKGIRFKVKKTRVKKTKTKPINLNQKQPSAAGGSAIVPYKKQAITPKDLVPKEVEEEPKKDKKEKDNFSPIKKTLESILKTLGSKFKFDQKQQDQERKEKESQKREKREASLEGLKKGIAGVVALTKKMLAPFDSILQRIWRFVFFTLLGRAFTKFMDWMSDKGNREKFNSFVEFLTDHWPALAGLYILFGTGFGKLVRGLLKGAARMVVALAMNIPKLVGFIKKNKKLAFLALAAAPLVTRELGNLFQDKETPESSLIPKSNPELTEAKKITDKSKDTKIQVLNSGGLVSSPVNITQQLQPLKIEGLNTGGLVSSTNNTNTTNNVFKNTNQKINTLNFGGLVEKFIGGGVRSENKFSPINLQNGIPITGAGKDDTLIAARTGEAILTEKDQIDLNRRYVDKTTGQPLNIPQYLGGRKPGYVNVNNIKFKGIGGGFSSGGVIERFNSGGIVGGGMVGPSWLPWNWGKYVDKHRSTKPEDYSNQQGLGANLARKRMMMKELGYQSGGIVQMKGGGLLGHLGGAVNLVGRSIRQFFGGKPRPRGLSVRGVRAGFTGMNREGFRNISGGDRFRVATNPSFVGRGSRPVLGSGAYSAPTLRGANRYVGPGGGVIRTVVPGNAIRSSLVDIVEPQQRVAPATFDKGKVLADKILSNRPISQTVERTGQSALRERIHQQLLSGSSANVMTGISGLGRGSAALRVLSSLGRGALGVLNRVPMLSDMIFPEETSSYDQLVGPNAYYNAPGYRGPNPQRRQGGGLIQALGRFLPGTGNLRLDTSIQNKSMNIRRNPIKRQGGGLIENPSMEDIMRQAHSTTVRIEHSERPASNGYDAEPPTAGSGVLVRNNKGEYSVLTARHVISDSGDNPITIITPDGKRHIADSKSLRMLEDRDLGSLRFRSEENYMTARSGDPSKMKKGDSIFVGGYPLDPKTGLQDKVLRFSTGQVTDPNSIDPDARSGGQTLRYSNQTQAGMSGGFVFNSRGELIGIHGQGSGKGVVEGSGAVPISSSMGTFGSTDTRNPYVNPNLKYLQLSKLQQEKAGQTYGNSTGVEADYGGPRGDQYLVGENPDINARVKKGFMSGGFIKENTGVNIPGATADRQLTALQPGEYVLPVDTVNRLGLPFIEKLVASTDSNSEAYLKKGKINRPEITPYSNRNGSNIASMTLPPINMGSSGSGRGRSSGYSGGSKAPSFSAVSPINDREKNAKMYYGIV